MGARDAIPPPSTTTTSRSATELIQKAVQKKAAEGTPGGRSRPHSLETLAFTLELLKRIPRNRKVSAPELWQQLQDAGWDRNLRTVQRQLDELSRQFDIDRDDRDKPYGYQWKAQAQGLSVPGLTERESLVLALAEQHLASLLPAEVMASMSPFFAQARSNLAPAPGTAAARAGEWMQKVRVVSASQPLLPPRLRPGVFDTVSSGLYRNHWLEVDYENSARRKLSARVMPLGIAQQQERLYLVCRFHGHEDERTLALHRMISVQDTGLPFQRPRSFDLAKFDRDGRFAFGDGRRVKLEILIGKDAGLHLLESHLSEDQQVDEDEKNYRIRATVAMTERLKWWLRGFGAEVTVLAPASLARAVHPHRVGVAA